MSRCSRRWRAAIRHRDRMRPARLAALDLVKADELGLSPWRFHGRLAHLDLALYGLSKRQRDAACRPLRRHVTTALAVIDKAAVRA